MLSRKPRQVLAAVPKEAKRSDPQELEWLDTGCTTPAFYKISKGF